MAEMFYRQMAEGVKAQAQMLDADRYQVAGSIDGFVLMPLPAIPEVDARPVWIIAILEAGRKTTVIPVAGFGDEVVDHTVTQVWLTWAIFRPSHVLGLPFLPLQYKEWKHADDPVLVSTDDVETQGWVKTNFVDIALSFIPTDVKIQTVYQIGDLEQVIRWEQERVRQPGKGI